jgi:flagellar protein FlbD
MLTRLNGHPMVVNSDLIKLIEISPDTVITLITGEKIVVRESTDEVLARVVGFRRSILSGETLSSAGASYSYPSNLRKTTETCASGEE